MTAVAPRPTAALPARGALIRPAHRLLYAVSAHRRDLAWLLPALLLGLLVQAINMAGAPQRIDDEGTYSAQAWAVVKLGELAHYTYWYDHPPLGWLQLALYGQATLAFDRYASAILAMREAILFFAGAAMVLLFVLARRIGLSRLAGAAAVVVFAVSPLAVQFHRTVYLDNVATPWLLAAFVLASARHRQLAAFTGAALAFGIAVLSKETFLLALPFLLWVVLRTAHRDTRRYTLAVAGSVLALVGSLYVAFAAVKGELLPGRNHVSLANGVAFQLANRLTSGSVLDPSSALRKTLAMWVQLDPVLLALGLLAALVGLALKPVRPYAAMAVALALVVVRPGGYTPVPYVIVLLPLFALLIAAVGERAVVALRRGGRLPRVGSLGWLALTTAAAIVAAPIWVGQLRGFLRADLDAPNRQAEQWLERNAPADSRLVVDDSMWVDLVRAGFDRNDVVWYYKIDTDPAVEGRLPNGWRDTDYVVVTDSMRAFSGASRDVHLAIRNSVPVATFGAGSGGVEIRRVERGGLAAARAAATRTAAIRSSADGDVARNPRVVPSARAGAQLRARTVDARLAAALAGLAAGRSVAVADFPVVAGENGAVRRQALLSTYGGAPLTPGATASATVRAALVAAGPGYAPQSVEQTRKGLLVTYSVDGA